MSLKGSLTGQIVYPQGAKHFLAQVPQRRAKAIDCKQLTLPTPTAWHRMEPMQSVNELQTAAEPLLGKMWWDDASISVELNPWATGPGTGTLLIGLGSAQGETAGVCLNHKGAKGPALKSVSAFVNKANAEQWQHWLTRLPNMGAIQKIVVEDFSLDTCLALMLFCNRLQQIGEDPSEVAVWVEYASAWETGQYLDGNDMTQSPACLVTALGHSYLPEAVQEIVHDGFAAEGLRACLRLLNALRIQRPSLGHWPEAAPPTGRDGARAIAHLRHEHQMYQLLLQRAARCQPSTGWRGYTVSTHWKWKRRSSRSAWTSRPGARC